MNRFQIYIQLALVSLISIILIVVDIDTINRDGVFYLMQAKMFLDGNYDKALDFYRVPFFSSLIALFSYLTNVSIFYSAHIINFIFFIISIFYFYKTLQLVSKSKIPLYFATIIILASPLIDDYMIMILRDHGYWAFFMMGVYYFVKWIDNLKLNFFYGWNFAFIFGALFRPESLILFIFLHLFLIFHLRKSQLFIKVVRQIFFLFLIISLFCILLFAFANIPIYDLGVLAKINLYFKIFINNIFENLDIYSDDVLLDLLLVDFTKSFKHIFFLYVSLYKWVVGLGVFYLFLLYIALKNNLVKEKFKPILFSFLAITFVLTFINLYTTFVLTNRYWVTNWLIVYLFASSALYYIWDKVLSTKILYKKLLIILFLFVIIFNLSDKPYANTEKNAIKWLSLNKIDKNDVFFADTRLSFYAGIIPNELPDIDKEIITKDYRYILLKVSGNTNNKFIDGYEEMKFFSEKNKKSIILLKRIDGLESFHN